MPYQDCKGCKNPVRIPFEWCGDPCRPEDEEKKAAVTEVDDTIDVPLDVADESLDFGGE